MIAAFAGKNDAMIEVFVGQYCVVADRYCFIKLIKT